MQLGVIDGSLCRKRLIHILPSALPQRCPVLQHCNSQSGCRRSVSCRAVPTGTGYAKRGLRASVQETRPSQHSQSFRDAPTCQSTSDDLEPSAKEPSSLASGRVLRYLGLFAVSAALLLFLVSSEVGISFRSSLMASWLGQSGFIAALSLIFLSEIGDKTFFICAILAMRLGRWISFLGTVAALGAMTVFSVGLGVAFNAIPDAMRTSIPIGKYLSVALLFFFGVRSVLNGANGDESELENEELVDAEETVKRAAESGQVAEDGASEEAAAVMGLTRFVRSVAVVAALIFVAEWGDRSMLTTIALGASQSPLGVALGGIIAHALAALIAVVGGSMISSFISEKTVNLVSGILFMIFAMTTALNWT